MLFFLVFYFFFLFLFNHLGIPEDSLIDDDSQPIEVENVGSPTPATPAHSVTTIDGNVDILEVAGPVVTTHKIRINITKSKQQQPPLPSTTNINNNLGNKTDDTSILDNLTSQSSTTTTATTTTTSISNSKNVNELIDVNIEYELKESLKNIDFKKIEPKRSGYETSGLCSIM
jgi:hypothetical protein